VPHVIYYASKTLNPALYNYTTTEKKMCVVVFPVEKFHPCLLGDKATFYTDHSAIKYMLSRMTQNLD